MVAWKCPICNFEQTFNDAFAALPFNCPQCKEASVIGMGNAAVEQTAKACCVADIYQERLIYLKPRQSGIAQLQNELTFWGQIQFEGLLAWKTESKKLPVIANVRKAQGSVVYSRLCFQNEGMAETVQMNILLPEKAFKAWLSVVRSTGYHNVPFEVSLTFSFHEIKTENAITIEEAVLSIGRSPAES